MAIDELMFSGLGANDLVGFQNQVQSRDPFNIASQVLAQWQPNYSYMDAGESGMTAFGKAFLSGLAGNFAQNRAGDQLTSVIGVLDQLRNDPLSVAVPEGVDIAPFRMLQGNSALRKFQRDELQKEQKDSRISDLLRGILPEMVKGRQMNVGEAIDIATNENPRAALEAGTYGKPALVDKINKVLGTQNPLSTGANSTSDKIQGYYQEFLDAGMPPVQAASAAKQQVEGEIKANTKSFDEAKAARETAQKLLTMSQTVDAGMSKAGQTGSGIASSYEKIIATLAPILPGSQAEAIEQSAGDALLNAITPESLATARPPGVGAMSDPEMREYLRINPSSSRTPEENRVLNNRIKKAAQLHMDYADFIDAYRDANSGSTIGADKKWMQYRAAVPLFDKSGDINLERQSWQDFFSKVGAEEVSPSTTTTTAAQEQPIPTGQYTKSGKQIYILNGVKGTID